jgi:transcriptional regulator with XRE-family HTH domain
MGLRLGVSSDRRTIEHQIDGALSRLITQVTNEITWSMREHGITRADLASRMGVSPGRVSQVLSGGDNLTLRTLAALATALDAEFQVELEPCKATADDYDARFDVVQADQSLMAAHSAPPLVDDQAD